MKHSHSANQVAAPFDKFEHARVIVAVNIRMPPIFNRSPISGFRNSQNFKPQLTKTREPPPRIHRDFMTAVENEPPKLGIDLRDQRALMSRIGSIERSDDSRIATLPSRPPSLNPRTSSHDPKLTRRDDEWKRQG